MSGAHRCQQLPADTEDMIRREAAILALLWRRIAEAIMLTGPGGEIGRRKALTDAMPYDAYREYTIVLFDNASTYFVTAWSEHGATPPRITLYGVDDNPTMKAMGLDKEFALVVNIESPDRFSIGTRFIDTRTSVREEYSFMTLEFTRVQ